MKGGTDIEREVERSKSGAYVREGKTVGLHTINSKRKKKAEG